MSARDELLDELDHLATVEHALCAGYLFLDCVLVDRGPGLNLAFSAMFQLRRLDEALVAAGQPANLTRADQVRGTPPTAFGPLDASRLDGLLDREGAIARAVDARYAVAGSLLAPVTDLDADLRDRIAGVVAAGGGHEAAFASFREPLAGQPPAKFLRPVREPAGDEETTLQSIGQRQYRLIVQLLEQFFATPDAFMMLALARDAMMTLGDVHTLLAERDLLPILD